MNTSAARPAVSADVADLRVQVGKIETMLQSLTTTIQEHFVARKESTERLEHERRQETVSLKGAIKDVRDSLDGVEHRLEKVETDVGNIKVGWAVLAKAATIGSAFTALVAGALGWLSWAVGWIKTH